MRKGAAIREIVRILGEEGGILPGSLSRLTQRRKRVAGRRPGCDSYWYLTWKEGTRSRALYVPAGDVAGVKRAVGNMKRIKGLVLGMAWENLRRLREERDVRKKG